MNKINNNYIDAINKSKLLSLASKRALIGLFSFWNKSKKIYASYQYLSDSWGISSKSVQRAISFFEHELKIISVQRKAGTTNKIEFIVSTDELIEILKNKIEVDDQGQIVSHKTVSNIDFVDLGLTEDDQCKGQNDLATKDKKTYYKEYYNEVNKENNNEIDNILRQYGFEIYLDSLVDFTSWENSNEVAFVENDSQSLGQSNCSSISDITSTKEETNNSSTEVEITNKLVSIDSLIDFTSNRSSEDDPSSKILHKNNISTLETMSSITYRYLKEIKDLSDFVNENNKIQFCYKSGKFYLISTALLVLSEPIPILSIGFDERIFQSCKVDGRDLIYTNGDYIKLGDILMIIDYVNCRLDTKKYQLYQVEFIKRLDYLKIK